jgi:superfamily I DNA and RNA helicase
MTPGEASAAVANVNKIGKHYSAKSVNEALQKFDNARREQVQKTGESPNTKASIVTNEAIDGSQASIELTLSRLKDYLPDYDPRTKNKL